MEKIKKSAISLILVLCTLLSLTACGGEAPAETTEAPVITETTVPPETAPSDAEIAAELMENYLNQRSYGVEITTDFGVSMAHSGEPVQSWSVYLTDDSGHVQRSLYHPVIKDQPQLQAQHPDAPTPAEMVQDLREGLKAGEIRKGDDLSYMVSESHGIYCFLVMEDPEKPPKLYNAALCYYAWSHPFSWLRKETQEEYLQKVLEDPARAEEFFALSEETYRDRDCLCVSYEMDPSTVRFLDLTCFEMLFKSQDNEYIQSRKVQPILRPGTPVSIKAYFDPETGACLGEIIDASTAGARLMDMMATVPNVTEGTGRLVTEKFYLSQPLESLPEVEEIQISERKDLHRIDLNYGNVMGEEPPTCIQSPYELVLDPIAQLFSVRENEKEIALLCPYLYFGMEPWDQYDLRNEFISEQETLERDQYDILINTVPMQEVFHYPSMGDQVGYVAKVCLKGKHHGAEIFSWDKETAVKIAETLSLS